MEEDGDELVHYFRQTDQTSAAIGQRQAKVFQTFGAIAGHGEIEAKAKAKPAAAGKAKKVVKKKGKIAEPASDDDDEDSVRRGRKDFGLTVRVEIYLPSDGTKEAYDNIFKSIKANLIDD